jgi:hypothetical protein
MAPSLVPPTLWAGKRAVLRLHLFGFDGFGAASNAASHRRAEHGCPSTARATIAPYAGPPHPAVPPASTATAGHVAPMPLGGSYKTSYAMEMAAARFHHDPTDVE